MKYSIGVDVGGTTIVAVLLKGKKIVKKLKIPTEKHKGKRKVISNILLIINKLISDIPKKQIIGVGVGFPGLVSKEKGRVLNCPNVSVINKTNIVKLIRGKFKLKCKIENDANAAALAESRLNKKNNLICISLGTGIGGGIIINGELYTGRGNGAELGHMIIDKNGAKCSCGNNGCLEAYISQRAILGDAKEFKFNNVKELAEFARENNKAKKAFIEMGKNLGVGLANIVNIFDPEIIILTGGVTGAADLFLKTALIEMNKRTWFKPCPVKVSKSREFIGAVGAGFLI